MAAVTARSESREEWITLGARVHGGFDAFIPVGIRIGLDALERLKASPREAGHDRDPLATAQVPLIADGIAASEPSANPERNASGWR
jgi:hypothetical protein